MKQYTLWLIISSILLFSCQNEGRWYPEAEVSVSSSVEYTVSGGGKAVQITLVVHNTGDTSITSSAVTVQVRTNAPRTYLQTASSAARIVPGGKVAVNITVPYLDANETLVTDGVTVYNAFFD
jgi:archaellum component FlaG (FlaF/FlaG flagellin family)